MLGDCFKCCGFSFYVANQDIYVAANTFQPPECLTQTVRRFLIPLSFVPAGSMVLGQVRDNTEKGRKEIKKFLYTAADLMFPYSHKMSRVCAEQFPVQAAVGLWMSQTALIQFLHCGWLEQAVAALHLHLGKCTGTAYSGLPLSLTALCDGKILDLAHLCQGVLLSWY